jgi:hypothetical protein
MQPPTDDCFGHPSGRTKAFTEPTSAITDETLTADIRHFKATTEDIRADTDWMQAMPEPIPIIAALTEARITELHIKTDIGLKPYFKRDFEDGSTFNIGSISNGGKNSEKSFFHQSCRAEGKTKQQ